MRCFAKYEQNMGERGTTSEPHIRCYTPRRLEGGECSVAGVQKIFFRSHPL